MKVFQIQQSKVGSNGSYSKGQAEVKNNQPQIAFRKGTVSGQTQPPSIYELRATQTMLKEQIGVMLQTETDPKRIKELNNYNKVLDVLLANEGGHEANTIKKTAGVSFGNASQQAEARGIVHAFSANAAVLAAAMAQAPGFDEAALAANDALMAVAICKVYGLSLQKSAVKAVLASIMGNQIGTAIFTRIAIKPWSWIPVVGNGLNAGVAGTVTEAIGHGIVAKCESGEMSKAIKDYMSKHK